jgi:hypothetical protein
MGLYPQKSFVEMYEDGGVEDTVGVEVEVRRHAQIYASLSGGGVHWWRFLAKICWEWLQLRRVKNPKGFGFYL